MSSRRTDKNLIVGLDIGTSKVVAIVGEVNEALVMLNQWDGCCIGVPPTPYDAVEVRLRMEQLPDWLRKL